MKYVTSVSNKEFDTVHEAMTHILDHIDDKAKIEKFEEELEFANEENAINVLYGPQFCEKIKVNYSAVDIIKTLGPDLYDELFAGWIEYMCDSIADTFEYYDDVDEVTTEFGEKIRIIR